MVCFNPITAYQRTWSDLTATPQQYEYGKKIKFKMPDNMENYREIEIPCGHCLGCRLDKSNEWATRIEMEMKNHKKNIFITLTYSNENVPKAKNHLTLCKRDVQLFIKRLRKHTNKKLSYFLCGEYGPKTHRPHYHAIIFGYEPKDLKLEKISKTNIEIYRSNELAKIWSKGFIAIEKATYAAGAYVARYVQKKAGITAKKRKYSGETELREKVDERTGEIYISTVNKIITEKTDKYGREKEFILASKKPAIGLNYFKENKEKIIRNNGIFVKKDEKTTLKPIPKYFYKKMEAEQSARLKYLKEKTALEQREKIKQRIKTNHKTINVEEEIQKHREYLEKNLKERAKYLKRAQV